MKKTILLATISGVITLCATAHAQEHETRERPPASVIRMAGEIRIDAASIRQRVAEGKLAPLPDAAANYHGRSNDRSTEDRKGEQE